MKRITKKQFDEHGWRKGDRIKVIEGNVGTFYIHSADVYNREIKILFPPMDVRYIAYTEIGEIIPAKSRVKLPPPEHRTPEFVKAFNEYKPKKGRSK